MIGTGTGSAEKLFAKIQKTKVVIIAQTGFSLMKQETIGTTSVVEPEPDGAGLFSWSRGR